MTTHFNAQAREKVLRGYIECILWTEEERLDEEWETVFGEPCGIEHSLGPASSDKCREDVEDFLDHCAALGIEFPDFWTAEPERIGRDFWLTRNGHGAGFWDRGQGEVGRILTDATKTFGGVDVFITSSGVVGVW